MYERESLLPDGPELGKHATVFVDRELGEPTWIGDDEDVRQDIRDLVGPTDDFNIVSTYTLHVALYALQNPTPENIRKALYLIGTSGDCEEATDEDTLMPLQQQPPSGWEKAWLPEELR